MGLLDQFFGNQSGLLSEDEKLLNQYYAPKARPSSGLRRQGNPTDAANLPVDVFRGRVAGLLGLVPDVLNFMGRSPMPTETFGETQYEPAPQLPFDTDYYLKNLPLAPTSRLGEVAGRAGSFVPLNPAPAIRAAAAGVKSLGPTAARMTEDYLRGQGFMPGIVPESPSGLLSPEIPVPKPQAPVSNLGFYSAAEQAAMNLQRGKGTGQSFLNDLMKAPDVKKDELQYTGLDEFLKDKPNVTRQEVTDYLSKNKVDVEEVQLGGIPFQDPVGMAQRKAVFDRYEPQMQALDAEYSQFNKNLDNQTMIARDKFADAHARLNTQGYMPTAQDYAAYNLAEEELKNMRLTPRRMGDYQKQSNALRDARDAEANAAYVIPESTPTKYKRFQLPGGENYREILLKLSEKTRPLTLSELNAQRAKNSTNSKPLNQTEYDALVQSGEINKTSAIGKKYFSPHFNEPNILAHMRVNDRVDADGKKMLLVEEIQSDWHQAGREKGYNTPEKRAAEQKKLDDLLLERQQLGERQKQLEELALPFTSQGKDAPTNILDEWNSVSNKLNDLQTEQNRLGRTFGDTGVPDAPFKDNWYQLSLKRLVKYAADNGYERIGLTTGKQQAERYDLAKTVDQIMASKEDDGLRIFARDKEGKNHDMGIYAPNQLTNVVGKDLAEKISNQVKPTDIYQGLDLSVGGEGMKRYYDEIYPKYLEKYGKKFDAKVGETKVNTVMERADNSMIPKMGQEPVQYIDITSKMKESVSKGQPLFAVAPIGGAGLGAGVQENQTPSRGLLQDEKRKRLSGLLSP